MGKFLPKKLLSAFLALVTGFCMVLTAASPAAADTSAASGTSSAAADPATVTTNSISGWPQAADVYSKCACLMDADTGTVLYNKGMDTQMFPASITKIMTCLLALENGKLTDQVTMTQTGVAYVGVGSSNLSTQVGEVFTLEQMLYGMMLKSANDMATQVGEYIGGGSIDHFVQMMNDKAAELGCTSTHFANACGMPDPNHYSSAHDIALIAQAALKIDEFRTIVNTPTYTIPATNMTATERSMTSHDPLLVSPDYFYPGIIGGKNGYTDLAQSTLTTFAERNGMTLIAVSLYATDGSYAAKDNVALLDYGFCNFQKVAVGKTEYNVSGGSVILPQNASLDDCGVKQDETKDASLGELLQTTYIFGDQTAVGGFTMTQENAKKYADEVAASEAAASKAASDAAASKAASDAAASKAAQNSGKDSAADPSASADSGSGTSQNVSGISAGMIAIAVLAVFVAAGLILIILAMRNKRRDGK